MIPTLMTHEWLRTRGPLGAVAGIITLLVLLGSGLLAIGWPVLTQLGLLLAFGGVMLLVPALQLTLTADYYRSSYSRTGYFTHSLPIKPARIYTAKLLWALLVSLLALVLTVVLAGVVWAVGADYLGLPPNPITAVGQLWTEMTSVVSTGMLIGIIALFVGLYLIWPVQYYFAVSRGSERSLNRLGLGGPVIVFVALYMGAQLASMLGLLVIPFGIGMQDDTLAVVRFSLIEQIRLGGAAADDVMPLGFLPALFLVAVYCWWRTVRSWNHKVSLV